MPATARDPERQKRGRIVSGAAAGVPATMWFTPGHRRAKTNHQLRDQPVG